MMGSRSPCSITPLKQKLCLIHIYLLFSDLNSDNAYLKGEFSQFDRKDYETDPFRPFHMSLESPNYVAALLLQRLTRGYLQRRRFARMKEMSRQRDMICAEVLSTERDYVHALIVAEKVDCPSFYMF